MRNLIREKRKISFENKRITPEIIRRLAVIVDNEVQSELNHDNHNCFISYSVDATDDSSYESQTILIFKERELIEQKVISKVVMRFTLLDNSKNIDIQLQHTLDDKTNGNYVLVSGDDPTWVNGVVSRINEVILFSESQPKYVKLLKIGILVSMLLFLISYSHFITPVIEKYSNALAGYAFLAVITLTLFGTVWLYGNIQEMFPLVELQTGFGYMQIPKRKRRSVNLIITIIFIPLLLATIYDMVKSFI